MQLSYDSRGNSVPTILLLMQGNLYAQGGLRVLHFTSYLLFFVSYLVSFDVIWYLKHKGVILDLSVVKEDCYVS